MRWALQISLVGLVALAIAAVVSYIAPFAPRVHDEFSYLLAADTLLHGRLANPSPEIWQPFQSFHIIVEPTYVSKYPLGQGIFVALGWLICGLPIAGCWLAASLCAASTTWMLAGITSRRWALAGGLLVACHPAMQTTWSQSLLSGWITAAGSTLLLGGVLRLRRGFRPSAAFVSGFGIALLALMRPFEGLVATCISSLLLWFLWNRNSLGTRLSLALRSGLVAVPPVAASLALIALHNFAVSGSLSGLPYRLHEQQYGVAPLFVFGHANSPAMEQSGQLPQTMKEFHQGWALDSFLERQGWWGWLLGIYKSVGTIWGFWVLLAIVPVLSAGWWGRFKLPLLLVWALAGQIMFSATVCWVFPHYLSPVLPWLAALTILGLKRIFRVFVRAQVFKLGQSPRFVGAILAAQVVLLLTAAVAVQRDPERQWALQRAAIASQLESQPGKHLVLVHYGADHNVHREWVYNWADLEAADIVWARGERHDWNQALIARYQHQRSIWSLEADAEIPQPKLLSTPNDTLVTNNFKATNR